jgi:hypothetical protein
VYLGVGVREFSGCPGQQNQNGGKNEYFALKNLNFGIQQILYYSAT